jgi:hypothetical protein
MLIQTLSPLASLALTSGPSQPEFSSFEPVATTNMVNQFTGAFTYNLPVLSIPGPNGSGYALSLSYHAGANVEEEASWVGYGWTLNPGSISRGLRGLPDDQNGDQVRSWNKVPTNWTVTAGVTSQLETFSFDIGANDFVDSIVNLSYSVSFGLRYNNYMGFGYQASTDLSASGYVSLGMGVSDGDVSFSARVNPAAILNQLISRPEPRQLVELHKYASGPKVEKSVLGAIGAAVGLSAVDIASQYGYHSFADAVQPTVVTPYTGVVVNVSLGGAAMPTPLSIGTEGTITGTFSEQTNVPLRGVHGYGYMYSGNAEAADLMDYYVEKESPYLRRDAFLGIPFSDADSWSSTGEGIAGGFRMYHRRVGHFFPTAVSSDMEIGSIEYSPHAGANVGLGIKAGAGHHSLSVGAWELGSGATDYRFQPSNTEEDERCFFRFDNDQGGSIKVAGTSGDDPYRADIDASSDIPGFTKHSANLDPTLLDYRINSGKRSGRSSFIAYHTNREMLEQSGVDDNGRSRRPIYYNSYNKEARSRSFVDRSDIGDGIGEIVTVNTDGNRYVYGLPVYARNEKNLQLGVADVNTTQVDSMYRVYEGRSNGDATTIIGQERDAPYATSYLLTEITTPDYIDRTHDGPTPDDFGGYTKFNYRRVAGSDSKTTAADSSLWFHWRIPYSGLLYNRNQLSTQEDDLGGVSSGDKEIYYLESIETKSHIAVFVTNKSFTTHGREFAGSGAERKDGFEAVHDELNARGNRNATTADGDNTLEFLERIDLYAKDSAGNCGTLLQKTHFRYNYSLCRNLPNAASDGAGGTVGKLTLEKVWTESEGVVQARISPYIFGYAYRSASYYPASISARYGTITSYAAGLDSNEQNPEYSPFSTDRWGNYQANGGKRHEGLNNWVDQTPDTSFDPAAWQLKWIRLPSGGEIHVQYEQNSYSHVQDRMPMAMVSLLDNNGDANDDASEEEFYVNLEDDLGITSPSEADSLCAMVRRRFVDSTDKVARDKIFFRFLYSLDYSDPGPTKCMSEYITGYVNVRDVQRTTSSGGKMALRLTLGSPVTIIPSRPIDVVRDFVKHARIIDIGKGPICDDSRPYVFHGGNAVDYVMAAAKSIGLPLMNTATIGSRIDFANSYLRLPMTRAKLGGGIRVKRLLMLDKGIESGDAALYGSEFLYEGTNRRSSGVATTEPALGREENALVGYTEKRTEQNMLERVIAGRDKEQFEGPIGESILPAPSVGYERVVTRNIHSGRTSPGFSINTFYTAREFPFDGVVHAPAVTPATTETTAPVAGRGVSRTTIDQETDWAYIPAIVFNYRVNDVWLTQGYRFAINSMHGQPRLMATYGGDYGKPDGWYLSASEEYSYFLPGQKVPMFRGINDVVLEDPGKETEVVMESRSVEDVAVDGSAEIDVDLGLFAIPIPEASLFVQCSYGQSKLRTHVTTKVIRYPAIVRSVTSFRDGVYHFAENIAFNPDNGQPVGVRTADGYDALTLQQSSNHVGSYTAWTFPASGQYPAMGQKGANERLHIRSGDRYLIERRVTAADSVYLNIEYLKPGAASELPRLLYPGDLLRLTNSTTSDLVGIYQIRSVAGVRVWLEPVSINHAEGTPYRVVDLEILRSGRTNQLSANVGSITTYGPPHSPMP